jgi:hypothetical protein
VVVSSGALVDELAPSSAAVPESLQLPPSATASAIHVHDPRRPMIMARRYRTAARARPAATDEACCPRRWRKPGGIIGRMDGWGLPTIALAVAMAASGCADDESDDAAGDDAADGGDDGGDDSTYVPNPLEDPDEGPPAGNPDGDCDVPTSAGLADVSSPRTVVGDGTPESCTADATIAAVAAGGVITFDCGPDPVTIELDRPAKIVNDTGPDIVIDGGGLVTLSGGNATRILYMNTCDPDQMWTTDHCDDQDHPRLTVQNLTFLGGNSVGEEEYDGGGAIWVRGGRLRVVNCRFFNNTCAPVGPDVGGAGIRVFDQSEDQPVDVVNSTFGGADGYGNECANGGGISSIGVSWNIYNSLFSHNRAIGNGANPAQDGTPGGGSGGAIYNDGNTMTLSLCGTKIESNEVNAHGSAIFFVSNDHSGDVRIDRSVITNNLGGSWYPTYPQISNHDDTPIEVTDSVIE